MTVQYLPNSGPSNNWDRPPQPGISRRVVMARQQRAKALATGHRILAKKTLGGDYRVAERMRLIAEAYAAYRSAGAAIIELELLD